MTLLQLRILREIERQALNISAAAKALNTSQPGVSRQMQMLERELGVALLVRKKNRIIAFSPIGRSILNTARSLLGQVENIEFLAREGSGFARQFSVLRRRWCESHGTSRWRRTCKMLSHCRH